MKEKLFIIGGDSVIGSHLIGLCRSRNVSFISTSRRESSPKSGRIHLDLGDHERRWAVPDDVHVAVICAGMTGLAACENNRALSETINVDSMLRLIDVLKHKNIRIVFLSTNQVFNGNRPLVPVDGCRNPVSVYGRQKTIVEDRLLSHDGPDAVVRMTKVVHPALPLFGEWKQSLLGRHPISAYDNLVMAPVHIDQAAQMILSVAQRREGGIFHMSASEDISYADMGYYLAEKYRADRGLVRPVHIKDSELPAGALPMHTTLDTSLTLHRLGIQPMGVWETIDRILEDGG